MLFSFSHRFRTSLGAAAAATTAAAGIAIAYWCASNGNDDGNGLGLTSWARNARMSAAATAAAVAASSSQCKASSMETALSPQEWRSFRLSDKRQLSSNSFFLRFELPTPESIPGLPVASCLLMRAPIGSSSSDPYVVRPYTPISGDDSPGHIDFVIKAYVPDGKLSQHLGAMAVGESIEMKGPINKIKYETNMKKEIGMIAGGTGITPMLQVAEEALRRPGDVTRLSLIFGNIREEDILLRERIDELARAYPSRFRVHYTLDKPGPEWEGGKGYVTPTMISEWMPSPSLGQSALVLVCGPPGMMRAISGDKNPDKSQGVLAGVLKEAGFTEEQVYKF